MVPDASGLPGRSPLAPAAPSPLVGAVLPEPGDDTAAVVSQRRGGILRIHWEAEPAHLHPLGDPDAAAGRALSGLVYEPLIDCRGDRYVPALAESWEVAPDGLKITLRLRPGVRWHDGQGFGVLDVQATVEPLLMKARAGFGVQLLREDLADVATIEIAADRVVRLKLKRPSDVVLRALCDVPILPDHLVRGWVPEKSPIAKHPIGTGPFRFLGWDRGKRVRLGRAPAGWRPGPAPALDEIHFEIDGDAARALTRVRRGEIDILPRVADVHYPADVDPVTLRASLTLYHLQPERVSFLAINHGNPLLADARVRKALAFLWDRDRFAAELHKGLAQPAAGLPFDRARAAALLEEAGYRDTNGDGVRERDGRPIRLTLVHAAGARTLAVETRAFVAELRKAGILLDVAVIDPSLLPERLQAGSFDLAPVMWQGRREEDPAALFGDFGARTLGIPRSAAIESLLADLRVAAGAEARRPILVRMAAAVADETPIILLYRHHIPALVSSRVRGLTARGDQLNLGGVWLDP